MPEWKDTVNLPRTDFPMKANLPTSEPETLARWAAMDLYGKIRAAPAGRAEVRPARRPAVRQRQHPHGHGAQQDPQGLRRQVALDGGLRRALRRRLRLPRPADRAEGRPRARRRRSARCRSADFCRACRAYAERFIGTMTEQFQRLGVLGTWDDPYLTMDFRYQAAIARAFGRSSSRASSTRARSRCTGASTAARRWPRPRSSTRTTRRRRSTSSFRWRRRTRTGARGACPGAGRPRRLGADLDDDAVDDSVEPGDRVPSGVRLRRLRRRRPRGHRRRRRSPTASPRLVGTALRPAVRHG